MCCCVGYVRAQAQRHALTAEVFAKGAAAGSVRLLQLLRRRGCPWDARAWQAAAHAGCVAVLEWLHAAGCPTKVRASAGQHGWS